MRVFNALLLATALALPMTGTAFADQSATITVTGEGRVDSRPDMASISLGVTTLGDTAAAAMAANSAELARVLENLRASGIADRDLQTTGLSLNPNWDSSYSGVGTPKITGYTASNMINVQVRALDSLGTVLDAAVSDGANSLNGVTFGLSEPEPAMDEARKRAVVDAKRRAALLAEAAGVSLGKVLSMSEGSIYAQPAPMFRADAASGAPVPIAEGEVSMTASVTMSWTIAE